MIHPRGFAVGTLFAATLLLAGDVALRVEPSGTKVEFSLGTTLHTVHGEFRLKSGALHFDGASGKVSGELTVDARSGDSGNSARDRRMHRDILDSEHFPEIVFRPARVEGAIAEGVSSPVKIHGRFVIRGVEHDITVPAEIRPAAGDYAVTAHFEIPYVKWGMKNPGNFMLHVDDTVLITIQTVAHPSTTPSL